MGQLKEARVPDIGDYDGVPVIELLVAVGDTVARDQSLVTLESDKATMEVPAPFAGVVRELKVKVGDSIAEGHVVAMIEATEDAAASAPAPVQSGEAGRGEGGSLPIASRPGASPASQGGAAAQPSEPDPTVEPVAVGTPDALTQRDIAQHAAAAVTADTAPSTESDPPAKAARPVESATPASADALPAHTDPEAMPPRTPPVAFNADELLPDKVPYASPAIRLFARELGVDLARVQGSARAGRITREDVQGFVKQVMAGGAAPSVEPGAAGGSGLNLLPWPKVDFAKFGPVERKTLTRIQKLSGANLSRNWAVIPHVTQHDDADITELEALRVSLNKENEKAKDAVKLTMLAFLMKASVAALKTFPDFNASLEGDAGTLVLKGYYNIGFAADTPNGLVVPVVRDVDSKGINAIARETGELAAKARDGKLGAAEMSGGCFTISSLGGIGGTAFTPIVNAPEVAILGVSKSAMKPVWDGTVFQPRLLLPLSLSYDHRVIDGAAAARFTAYLAQLLGDMRRVLL